MKFRKITSSLELISSKFYREEFTDNQLVKGKLDYERGVYVIEFEDIESPPTEMWKRELRKIRNRLIGLGGNYHYSKDLKRIEERVYRSYGKRDELERKIIAGIGIRFDSNPKKAEIDLLGLYRKLAVDYGLELSEEVYGKVENIWGKEISDALKSYVKWLRKNAEFRTVKYRSGRKDLAIFWKDSFRGIKEQGIELAKNSPDGLGKVEIYTIDGRYVLAIYFDRTGFLRGQYIMPGPRIKS